ncbi:hypothetical protein SAMN04488072_11456 [Lentibacillus halodurans]|uniref:Uncharacterized protein n=1 Tax=Lentibacillus halodurans TaxID=237679 RepID=A0A1I0ZWY8_9BACI|nr:hypothetical protein [Lentibacillus halodurans]SFB30209.1 hypothetical protein SAMN04488072_11456 [Lentibacillus halodurans]
MNEQELYYRILEQKEQLQYLLKEHWQLFSNMSTWFFWFNLATVIIPLVILYFSIDRKRLFEVAFYGYSMHVLWLNIDMILTGNNYFNHPHSLFYILPEGVSVTSVFLPVVFMLLYQHCTNNGKNFYLYATVTSTIFAFGFGFFAESVDLLRMHKGMNLFYLTLIDIAAAFIAYWATNIFLMIKKQKPERRQD